VSTRLQVVLDGAALRDRKAQAIRASARHAFPTADVERMLAELEGGYLGHRPAGP
jgi:hypothetical protein